MRQPRQRRGAWALATAWHRVWQRCPALFPATRLLRPKLNRLRLAAIVLAAVLAPALTAQAQPAGTGTGTGTGAALAEFSEQARGRLVDASGIAQALARGGVANVIVEFAPPPLPPGLPEDSAAADLARSAAIHHQQDRILARALVAAGTPPPPGGELPSMSRMDVSPMFAISADQRLLQALAEDPEVLRVHLDGLRAPQLNRSLGVIGMPAVYEAGATGSGQVIALLDTGVRLSHEHLSSRVIDGACFNLRHGDSISRCPGGAESAFGLQAGDDCTNPSWFGCGHGTHVASIAAGLVAQPGAGVPAHGVARDARIVSMNVFSRFGRSQCPLPDDGDHTHCLLSYDSDQIRALERVYTRRHIHNFAAVNLSLGGGRHTTHCNDASLRPVIQRLTRAGIAVIIAAGNDGHDNAIGFPACVPEAITVANADLQDRRYPASNWGGLVDLVAPGTAIRAAYISGQSNAHYREITGTSMATPHVAGAFAAIRSVRPDASPAAIRGALIETGSPVRAAGRTLPRINVDAALDRLSIATTTTLSGPAIVSRGRVAELTVGVTAANGTPTGTVSLRRDGVQIATSALDTDGRASFSPSNLPLGASQLTARFVGGAGFAGSTSAPLELTVMDLPVGDSFIGGGVVFGQTEACAPSLGTRPHAVTIRYSPSELRPPQSSLSLVWAEGSEWLGLWGDMAPSADFLGGSGRQSWSRFVFYPTRPRMRVIARQVTAPAGAPLIDAWELVLRLRVQNFGSRPGCAATVVASLRRS